MAEARLRIKANAMPVLVLRAPARGSWDRTSIVLELEDGTLVGFFHLHTQNDGVVSGYWELSDQMEEVGVPRVALDSAPRAIYVRRKEADRG